MFFDKYGFEIDGIKHLTPKEASLLLRKNAVLVDIREDYKLRMKSFGAENIIYLCMEKIKAGEFNLPKEGAYIIADSSGLHSKEALLALKEEGYKQLANLAGGLLEWENEGLPVITDRKERLSGACPCQLKPKEK